MIPPEGAAVPVDRKLGLSADGKISRGIVTVVVPAVTDGRASQSMPLIVLVYERISQECASLVEKATYRLHRRRDIDCLWLETQARASAENAGHDAGVRCTLGQYTWYRIFGDWCRYCNLSKMMSGDVHSSRLCAVVTTTAHLSSLLSSSPDMSNNSGFCREYSDLRNGDSVCGIFLFCDYWYVYRTAYIPSICVFFGRCWEDIRV